MNSDRVDRSCDQMKKKILRSLVFCLMVTGMCASPSLAGDDENGKLRSTCWLGQEISGVDHLSDDQEFQLSIPDLIAYGKKLFTANWTEQEGGGRLLTKGNGKDLSDPSQPLVGARGFNRLSAPDANSCASCHNPPYGIPGGGGDFVTNVFVLGPRFDFLTFDRSDQLPTKGAVDEDKKPVSLQNAANMRATPGMFGSGCIEMLARQMTEELQTIRTAWG